MKISCEICPHRCMLDDGQTGLCGARKNDGGRVVCDSYGKLTSLCLDPIEKKPFARFMPGTKILSAGSYGCNMRCPFCQNHSISLSFDEKTLYFSPDKLVKFAESLIPQGNIGLAFTYNEPLISYEYVYDTSSLAKRQGQKTALVTNGFINEEPLRRLLPYIDAMNIDLKGFSAEFYKKLQGGLEEVKNTIAIAAGSCHVEVTTLIIPGENDTEEEMKNLAGWVASIREDIPLHVSRFFPSHLYSGKLPTPVSKVYKLAETAREFLKYVYTGNC